MQKKVRNINLSLIDEIKQFRNDIKSVTSEFEKLISDGDSLVRSASSPSYVKNLTFNKKMLTSMIDDIQAFLNNVGPTISKGESLSRAAKTIRDKYTEGMSFAEKLGVDTKELRGYASLFNESDSFTKNYLNKLTKLQGDLAGLI